MDSTSITIQLGNDNVRISSLYKSPKMPLQLTDLEAITNQKLKFIAAGDLNAKHPTWNSRTTNTSGNLLQNHMESSNSYTICAPVSPTHHSYNPKHAPEVLDIVISNLNDRDFTLNNHNDLSSDHNPIILSISDSITSLNPPKARKRINWKKFEKYLSENLSKINNIKSTEDIDKEISTLTKTIQSALEINSYTVKFKYVRKLHRWTRFRPVDEVKLKMEDLFIDNLMTHNMVPNDGKLESITMCHNPWLMAITIHYHHLERITCIHILIDFFNQEIYDNFNLRSSNMIVSGNNGRIMLSEERETMRCTNIAMHTNKPAIWDGMHVIDIVQVGDKEKRKS
ncbi:hypothetical protein ACI65C_008077 [Semiaphis heraclei]